MIRRMMLLWWRIRLERFMDGIFIGYSVGNGLTMRLSIITCKWYGRGVLIRLRPVPQQQRKRQGRGERQGRKRCRKFTFSILFSTSCCPRGDTLPSVAGQRRLKSISLTWTVSSSPSIKVVSIGSWQSSTSRKHESSITIVWVARANLPKTDTYSQISETLWSKKQKRKTRPPIKSPHGPFMFLYPLSTSIASALLWAKVDF